MCSILCNVYKLTITLIGALKGCEPGCVVYFPGRLSFVFCTESLDLVKRLSEDCEHDELFDASETELENVTGTKMGQTTRPHKTPRS